MTSSSDTSSNDRSPGATADGPVHVHGPDCDHDHDHDHGGHVHGPNCNHDHHHHAPVRQVVRAGPKIGRNDACPCGSGKKYKKCHGGVGAG